MAYKKKRYGKSARYGRTAKAGKVAARVSTKAFKGAMKMSKIHLAKVYAQKCGQAAFRAAKNRKYGKKKRFSRMKRRMRY